MGTDLKSVPIYSLKSVPFFSLKLSHLIILEETRALRPSAPSPHPKDGVAEGSQALSPFPLRHETSFRDSANPGSDLTMVSSWTQ